MKPNLGEKLHCSRCDKCMTNEQGTSMIGITLELNVITPDANTEHAQNQLGKYKMGKRYMFCYECWLDSLFRN